MGLAPRRAYVDCCLHAHLPRHMAMGMTYLLFAYPQSTSRLFCTWVSIHTSFSIAVYPLLYMVYLSIFQTLHLSVFSFMFHLKKSTFKSVTIWFNHDILPIWMFIFGFFQYTSGWVKLLFSQLRALVILACTNVAILSFSGAQCPSIRHELD